MFSVVNTVRSALQSALGMSPQLARGGASKQASQAQSLLEQAGAASGFDVRRAQELRRAAMASLSLAG